MARARTSRRPIASSRARPEGLQGIRRPRRLPGRARRGGRVRDRPGLRRALRAEADRGRARHARLLAVDGGRADRRRRRRGRRRARPRARRHRDGLFRRRRPRARRGRRRHRLAQPQGVHGDEDRQARRAARRRRVRAARDSRPRSRACVESTQALPGPRRGHGAGHLAGLRRQGALVRRPRGDATAARRPRRRERDGGGDAAAGARAAAGRGVDVLLRARRDLPKPRAEPAAPREPRVHRPDDPRAGSRPRGRLRRRRRSMLLRRRHGRVRPGRLRDGAARPLDPARRRAAAR